MLNKLAGMIIPKKKLRGIELIDAVAGRFNTMIEELDEGVSDCRMEQNGIRDQIESLNQRSASLNASVERASTIATNLRSLLGE
ncbi:hypothetical protein LCGC14_0426510 [marine sediment metagenome]|uniref:Uncharacterized protein n=1 Tax=marine sediment metagenome TaxID=412755 RepID=A0A0F9VYS3_9ZZZZ